MKRVLIVKTSALGDVVHSYPVARYLKQKFPGIAIDWVVEKACAGLVEAHPDVDRVVCVSTKEWRKSPFSSASRLAIKEFRKALRQYTYDAVFDLQGNVKSGLIVAMARSKCKVGFGSKSVAEWPNMLFTNKRYNVPKGQGIHQDYLALAASFSGEQVNVNGELKLSIDMDQQAHVAAILQQDILRHKPVVLVSPGSAWPNKQLSNDTLIAFLGMVRKHLDCAFIFLWGSPGEYETASLLHSHFSACSLVADKMPLPTVQNLMSEVKLVIAMDSLPLHLAGTTSTPTFSVFGPSSAAKYKPAGAKHFAYQGSCPYGRTFEKRCPILRTCPTGACMHAIKADELFAEFMVWFKR